MIADFSLFAPGDPEKNHTSTFTRCTVSIGEEDAVLYAACSKFGLQTFLPLFICITHDEEITQ